VSFGTARLRSNSTVMAIGAVDRGHVAQIHRVLEGPDGQGGNLRPACLLLDDGVARVAILADDPAFLAHVVAIVAAEASLEVKVTDIIGMRLPVELHLGEEGGAIDALQLGYGRLDAVGLAGSDL